MDERPVPRHRRAAVAVVSALALAGTACSASTADQISNALAGSTPTPTVAPAAAGAAGSAVRSSTPPIPPKTALALLATLAVKGRAPMTGYSRAQFGPAWQDVDHNGCDTRDDVLTRDLTAKKYRTGTHNCVVIAGRLADPYTAKTIVFTKAKATAVQIDHMVALGDAWQTGAARWTAAKRLSLANDPLNLSAVDGPANEAKGDADAASWLPPNKAFRCTYVTRQVQVKARYQLSVTPAERNAIKGILSVCATGAAVGRP